MTVAGVNVSLLPDIQDSSILRNGVLVLCLVVGLVVFGLLVFGGMYRGSGG